MDWGQGHYERIADQIQPAAEAVIGVAAPRPGQTVADLGTGTGNGALLAAERGARVIGVDPAERLLSVAAERARERGLDLDLRVGDAASIPLEDGEADLVISVFGVVFAPDAAAAAAEMARIAAPDGRIVLCAWLPEGAIAEAAMLSRRATAAATGAEPGPPPFAWHDRVALQGLFGPLGFAVELEERGIPFRAPSSREWLESEIRFHPLRVAASGVLDEATQRGLERRSLEIFEAANEDPDAFQVTSRYVIVTASRAG